MIKRNFGIKNALVIILIVYGLYSLTGKMAIKSGRRKLRGGAGRVSGPAETSSDNVTSIQGENFIVKKWRSIFGKHSGGVAAALVMLISLVVGLIIGIEYYA